MPAETRATGPFITPFQIGAIRVFVASGLPLASNGSNGDLHIDPDGNKSAYRPTMYQKQGGTWVAVA